mgnify:CR=1 FL=1
MTGIPYIEGVWSDESGHLTEAAARTVARFKVEGWGLDETVAAVKRVSGKSAPRKVAEAYAKHITMAWG